MLDQVFETFRKASESSLQMQQEMFKQWSQQWLSAPPGGPSGAGEWGTSAQKRWFELAIELMKRQRESLDTLYKSGIQVLEQTLRVSEAKSAEDYRRAVEDVSRKLYDTFKDQSEAQVREFQRFAERSFELFQRAG